MRLSLRQDEVRCAAAICAAAMGVLICLHQHHFTLRANVPSFELMMTHRCGLTMLAATAWATLETSTLLLPLRLNLPPVPDATR